MQRYTVYSIAGIVSDGTVCRVTDHEGEYVLHSEAQERIEALEAALRIVANLNEDAGEIGEGMLHRIVSTARSALENSNEPR